MHWLRNWFRGDRTATTTRAHTARPALEKLEDRCTPSLFGAVSSVSDAFGNNSLFDVHQNGTLFFQYASQPNVLITSEGADVKSVSAGTDNQDHVDALVVHNNGNLTMHNASQLAGYAYYGLPDTPTTLATGVKSVVAEGNGKALVIDSHNFLWQYDPNQASLGLPVDMYGLPQFAGQPSRQLGPSMTLLDAHVTQATPLTDAYGQNTVIALHSDGTLTSDQQTTVTLADGGLGFHMWNNTIGGGAQSISSAAAPGGPYANYLYTVTSNGHVQKDELSGTMLRTDNDYGNANGAGFKDVNVGWNSGDWVATTNTGQVYRDSQLMDTGVASAFAGPGGTFYAVFINGDLYQWSPQLSYLWMRVYNPFGGWTWKEIQTHWTYMESNVSTN
jgi:hypothetical protein